MKMSFAPPTVQSLVSLKGIRVAAILLSLMQTSCHSGSLGNQSTQFASASATKKITTQQIKQQLQSLGSSSNQAMLQQIDQISLHEYFAKLFTLVTNDPMEIGGYTFTNMHDRMIKQEADLQALSDRYSTMGDYMSAMGITSPADVPSETIDKALATLDKMYNQGGLERLQNSARMQTTSPFSQGLSLAGALPCAGSSIGMGAAVGGATLACIVTEGKGCGAAVAGVASSSIGVANSCGSSSSTDIPVSYNPSSAVDTTIVVPGTTSDDTSGGPQPCVAGSKVKGCTG